MKDASCESRTGLSVVSASTCVRVNCDEFAVGRSSIVVAVVSINVEGFNEFGSPPPVVKLPVANNFAIQKGVLWDVTYYAENIHNGFIWKRLFVFITTDSRTR